MHKNIGPCYLDNLKKLQVCSVDSRAVTIIKIESIHMHFRLNRFTSTESIQRILIESISTHKFSGFSYKEPLFLFLNRDILSSTIGKMMNFLI